MKKTTLVIHPGNDPTTDFLKGIYKDLQEKTIFTSSKTELRKYMNHDQVLMMGHGSSSGLFSIDIGSYQYIIDESMADCLRTKMSNIYIWCNADQYVHCNRAQWVLYRDVHQ